MIIDWTYDSYRQVHPCTGIIWWQWSRRRAVGQEVLRLSTVLKKETILSSELGQDRGLESILVQDIRLESTLATDIDQKESQLKRRQVFTSSLRQIVLLTSNLELEQ